MRKKKPEKENSERWLLTYSDMITLLLALFILLYGMSTINQTKYEALATSLNSALGDGKGGSNAILSGNDGMLSEENIVSDDSSQSEDTDSKTDNDQTETNNDNTGTSASKQKEMEDLKNNIDNIIAKYYGGKDVTSTLEDNGIVLTFSSNICFESGKDTLSKDMKKALDKMASQLNQISNHVLVEGHTDNIPMRNGRYPSNWQLSSIRAANVVQYLVEEGKVDANRLSAVGCGANQPVASNATAEGRNQNRRIRIIILNQ